MMFFVSATSVVKTDINKRDAVKLSVKNKQRDLFVFNFTGEADETAVDPSPETATSAPDKVEDKAGPVEQSPAEAAEPGVEEKTDDEGLVSNKTSVESLKETNENNSNNADFGQKRGDC